MPDAALGASGPPCFSRVGGVRAGAEETEGAGVGVVVVTCASCGHVGEAPAGAKLYECSRCGAGVPGQEAAVPVPTDAPWLSWDQSTWLGYRGWKNPTGEVFVMRADLDDLEDIAEQAYSQHAEGWVVEDWRSVAVLGYAPDLLPDVITPGGLGLFFVDEEHVAVVAPAMTVGSRSRFQPSLEVA